MTISPAATDALIGLVYDYLGIFFTIPEIQDSDFAGILVAEGNNQLAINALAAIIKRPLSEEESDAVQRFRDGMIRDAMQRIRDTIGRLSTETINKREYLLQLRQIIQTCILNIKLRNEEEVGHIGDLARQQADHRRQIDVLAKENSDLKAKLVDEQRQKEKLTQDLEEQRKERELAEKQRAEEKQVNERLLGKVREQYAEATYAKAKIRVSEIPPEQKQLERRVNLNKDELERLKIKLAEVCQKLVVMQAERSTANKEFSSGITEYLKTKGELETLRLELDRKINECFQLRADKQYRQQGVVLQEQEDEVREQLTNVEKQIREIQERQDQVILEFDIKIKALQEISSRLQGAIDKLTVSVRADTTKISKLVEELHNCESLVREEDGKKVMRGERTANPGAVVAGAVQEQRAAAAVAVAAERCGPLSPSASQHVASGVVVAEPQAAAAPIPSPLQPMSANLFFATRLRLGTVGQLRNSVTPGVPREEDDYEVAMRSGVALFASQQPSQRSSGTSVELPSVSRVRGICERTAAAPQPSAVRVMPAGFFSGSVVRPGFRPACGRSDTSSLSTARREDDYDAFMRGSR